MSYGGIQNMIYGRPKKSDYFSRTHIGRHGLCITPPTSYKQSSSIFGMRLNDNIVAGNCDPYLRVANRDEAHPIVAALGSEPVARGHDLSVFEGATPEDGEATYTVAEYRPLLTDYINSIKTAQSKLDAANTALTDATAT